MTLNPGDYADPADEHAMSVAAECTAEVRELHPGSGQLEVEVLYRGVPLRPWGEARQVNAGETVDGVAEELLNRIILSV